MKLTDTRTRRILAKWIIGIGLSLAFPWVTGALLVDGLDRRTVEPALGFGVPTPGTTRLKATEGWAWTHWGRLGVSGIPDASKIDAPLVAIWGDSFVEAAQVPDADKMHIQLNAMAKAQSVPLHAVGIGRFGRGLADYRYLIPKYEKALPNIAMHVVVLGQSGDLLPDQKTQLHSKFVTKPAPAFVEKTEPGATSSRRALVARLGLQGYIQLAERAKDSLRDMRFRPGPVRPKNARIVKGEEKAPPSYEAAWNYALDEYRKATDKPILFVIALQTPDIIDGELQPVEGADPEVEAFARLVARHPGMSLVDLTPAMSRAYLLNNRSPRGFANSHPWEGHLNDEGHRVMATELLRLLREDSNALFAD